LGGVFPHVPCVPEIHSILRSGFPSYTPFTRARAEEQAPHTDGDGDVLKRTLDMLRSDDDLEQFFEIPIYCMEYMPELVTAVQMPSSLLYKPSLSGFLAV